MFIRSSCIPFRSEQLLLQYLLHIEDDDDFIFIIIYAVKFIG